MKRTRKSTSNAVTPQEACEIFQSAVSYLQAAGFAVRAGNRDGKLVVVVPGIRVNTDESGTRFALAESDGRTEGNI